MVGWNANKWMDEMFINGWMDVCKWLVACL